MICFIAFACLAAVATSQSSTTSTDSSDCTSFEQLDACTRNLGVDVYSHLGNSQAICGDLANFENCILAISCLSPGRKNALFSQGRQVVSDVGVTCPTNIPWMTTRQYADCYSLAELDTCTLVFRDSVNAHYPNQGLVCRDVAVFSDCVWGISCLKIEERYQLILDAKAVVNNFNIFCDSTGPDDGGNMSGANVTANKSIFSYLLVLVVMGVLFMKYN